MKAKQIILLAATLFSLAACEIEEPFSQRDEIVEGIPVTLAIPFKTDANRIITRAAQDQTLERTVDNVYLFIFDEAGNKIGNRFCTVGENGGMVPETDSTGRLYINTTSQNKARIVGIANLNVGTVSTAYNITQDMLDDIETYGQLSALQMKLSERSVQRGSTFIMTGFAKNDAGEEWVQIPGSEGGAVKELKGTLRFERTDAKIEIVVKSEAEAEPQTSWKNFSFQPKEWRVCQVPAQSLVMKDETGADADGTDTEYFSTMFVNFEKIDRVENNATLYKGGSFVFYMPENKKKPKASIPTNNPEDPTEPLTAEKRYALRDKQEKIALEEPVAGTGQSVENGDFVYANQNSTYIEITGTLSYQYTRPNDQQTYSVESDVRYVVHLGYASGDPDDYDTERNTHYIYTITVRGVNDIVVEVTNDSGGDDEIRPGAEGDVIYSRNGIYEFDAHYDRILITIPLSEIPDGQTDPDAANGVTWGVRTPFSNGIYDLNAPNNFSGIEDYKWVKFAINSDYGVAENEYVKYPGDQNYDDPRPEAVNDNQQPGTNEHGLYGEGWENARLLDVQQFVDRINKMKADEKDGNVAVTVFIDEYVYYRNPVTYDNDLSLWKYSVDQPDRMMYLFIVPGESKYSPDGESFVINSVLTFRQKSLRTIYDVNNPDLTNGKTINGRQGLWGLESIMETGRLETGGSAIANGDSRSNGRRNTLRCMLGPNYNRTLRWSDVLNTDESYAMNDEKYRNALYACLMRNRDLNGDNIVQANEIRWYLASVNQLVDIYIGEYALDREAWLYPENAADRENKTYWHYTTSTYNNGNPEVLWAEEGASLGSYDASQRENGSKYAYRCVRNLGISIDDPDTEPLPLYTYKTENGEYLIDATRLSVKSRRENFEAGYLPKHNDLSTSNLPYARFQVQGAGSDIPAPKYDVQMTGWEGLSPVYDLVFNNEQTWEECLQYEDGGRLTVGYRLPNQRELLIMLNILPDEAWRSYQESHWTGTKSKKAMYMCKTQFSRAGKDHFGENRLSFRMNANDKSIGLLNDATSDRGFIRAVKDVR